MHFFKKFTVFIMCFYKFGLSDSSNRNYPCYENVWRSQIPSGNSQDFHNVPIYLGYVNNPFGASSPVLPNKKNGVAGIVHSQDPSDNRELENTIDQFSTDTRSKRGVIHLYNMISCATGCSPLIYKGYGCYCGFLGSGYAVDGIDRCCKMHDWCYDTANCPMFLEYFVPYYWKCYRNRPLCAVPEEQRGGPGSCAQRLCECDRLLSQCLSQYPCPTKRAYCRSSPWRLFQNVLMG